jgi:hypothetical protein
VIAEQDGPPLSPAHDHIDLRTVALVKDLAEGIELSFVSVRVLVGILYKDHRVISRSSVVSYCNIASFDLRHDRNSLQGSTGHSRSDMVSC